MPERSGYVEVDFNLWSNFFVPTSDIPILHSNSQAEPISTLVMVLPYITRLGLEQFIINIGRWAKSVAQLFLTLALPKVTLKYLLHYFFVIVLFSKICKPPFLFIALIPDEERNRYDNSCDRNYPTNSFKQLNDS
ncbi:hypothetical protein SAMN05216271_3688 [Halopseudomonas sabulinigri]|uniref:Uncharacterized protein n=1 Tax=Halopseudomonas sabulinigri TaxID=472181 RepID=A0A1H1XVT9_9GAMM|nr:hypothetical protein SAMN05216271_3688 [Halopseudomonas sabulinigri]